jgi:radical SAM superfamily enzyme YgiQ (UPF0313 family)
MSSTTVTPTIAPVFDSQARGDIVLATPPPYLSQPWLGAGPPLLAALLKKGGIETRIARLLERPYDVPRELYDHGQLLEWTHPTLEARFSWTASFVREHPGFFEGMIQRLLAGGERIIGLSAWRPNVDVVLELARQIKLRAPERFILLGGPEAAESPDDVRQEYVDAVVTGTVEGTIVHVVRAFLDGEPREAGRWADVWINPRHGQPAALRRSAVVPPTPRIDYSTVVPMMVEDPDPIIPLLLNIGCAYRCTFCVNTNLYPNFELGDVGRVVAEMQEILETWAACFPTGEAPPVKVLLCDAAVNASPEQFDELCDAIAAADFPIRPKEVRAMVVVDRRMTVARAKKAAAAGFQGAFFGLESAVPRIRKSMKKPGTIESVREGLENCVTAGLPLSVGIIVGWPDETEEEFTETLSFLEWMLSVGATQSVSATPMRRSEKLMDKNLLSDVEGDLSGVMWRGTGAAGSPAVRGRRFLHVFEHFRNIAVVFSSLPPYFMLSLLYGDTLSPYWQRWLEKEAKALAKPAVSRPAQSSEAESSPQELPSQPAPRSPTQRRLAALRAVEGRPLTTEGEHWHIARVSPMLDGTEGALLEAVSSDQAKRVGLVLSRPGTSPGTVWLSTPHFDVAYLSELNGERLATDRRSIGIVVRGLIGMGIIQNVRPPKSIQSSSEPSVRS